MALALAIMMVVLVGVMGAGLLVFVQSELDSVIESNKGQKAFNFSDAGIQIAKARLLTTNADFRSFDGITDLNTDPPNPESAWSCGVWNSTNNVCGSAGRQLKNLDSDPDLDATVWIQYLKPSITTADLSDPTHAPELVPSGQTNYPPGKDYFRVISQGSEGGTVRKIEAIYNTYDLGVPKAYYTPGNITLNGNAGSITNISLFAGGSVDGSGGDAVTGEDLAYGNWCRSPFNTWQRGTTAAGIGALGSIANQRVGRDFDGVDPTDPDGADFVGSPSSMPSSCISVSSTGQLTFPFKASLPDIEALRTAAQSQSNGLGGDNYYEFTGDANVVGGSPGANDVPWPANSLSNTVVFVKFDSIGDRLTWNISGGCSNNPVRGTVVVEGGIFTTQPNRTPLRGAVVITSAPSPTDVYTDSGNTCMQSFAIASGDIVIGGNVSPATQERGNSPGSYGINLWSWRECYSMSCN